MLATLPIFVVPLTSKVPAAPTVRPEVLGSPPSLAAIWSMTKVPAVTLVAPL